MIRFTLLSILLLFVLSGSAQKIEIYDDFKEYQDKLIEDDHQIAVVNYWATWCAPCIKELPYFEKLGREYKSQNVAVILVSIDFKNQYEKKLVPFIKKNKLESRLIHMADPKSNEWIPEVNSEWSGAIPITQFIKGKHQKFMEKSFDSYEELKMELDNYLETIQ